MIQSFKYALRCVLAVRECLHVYEKTIFPSMRQLNYLMRYIFLFHTVYTNIVNNDVFKYIILNISGLTFCVSWVFLRVWNIHNTYIHARLLDIADFKAVPE